jgi:hypothetical protein
MHRISNGSQVTSLPTPAAVTGTPGFATAGVVGSLAPTVIDPDTFNTHQEELVGIVLAGALALDKTNNGQVLAALKVLFATGRLINVRVFSAVGTTVYTPTTGTKAVIPLVMAGGGGAAGAGVNASGFASAGIPGNGGAFGASWITSGFAGVTITVGAGGVSNAGLNGSSGGASSFGTLLSCPGGPGGTVGPSQNGSASGGNGNSSGLPSGWNLIGMIGGLASPTFGFTTGQVAFGGNGGPSAFGSGGPGQAANANGNSATSYGSGGGGCIGSSNSGALTGGFGQQGIVIVLELG